MIGSHDIFFSVVIPTYNRAERIQRTIDSIICQDFDNVEVIVVDDGSTDETAAVVSKIGSALVRYISIQNSERGAARNVGSNIAKGRYVNYFDSDDVMLPCLASLQEFLVSNNYPDVVYGVIQHEGDDGTPHALTKPPFTSFRKNIVYNNFLSCGAVFLSASVAKRYRFVEDRRLATAEDWELWLRIGAEYRFTLFSNPVFIQIHHASRSLNSLTPQRIEERDRLFAGIIRANQNIIDKYGHMAIRLFVADRYTFIALAWSSYSKVKSFHYLMLALSASVLVLRRRRFWAVLLKCFKL